MTTNELLVREGIAAFNSGDVETFLTSVGAGARFYPAEYAPDFESFYEGREGFTRFFDRWGEPWDNQRVEIERINDERELVTFDMRWSAERAGAPPVEMPLGCAIKVHAGVVTLMVTARTAAEARERLLTIAPVSSEP